MSYFVSSLTVWFSLELAGVLSPGAWLAAVVVSVDGIGQFPDERKEPRRMAWRVVMPERSQSRSKRPAPLSRATGRKAIYNTRH